VEAIRSIEHRGDAASVRTEDTDVMVQMNEAERWGNKLVRRLENA